MNNANEHKVFMIGVGGSVKNANIEVHDVQFVIATKLEETFEVLKNRWYGEQLHVDSYIELKTIDNYLINLNMTSKQNLYMIVYGGYKNDHIDELHMVDFVLATSAKEAKAMGKAKMRNFSYMDHIDNVVDVFKNVGHRFGFEEDDCNFKDNTINHTFIKLIENK
ncbi:MAG: DUF1543 domain-containing protein [Candidatus Izemoplasmataceae bacterium]